MNLDKIKPGDLIKINGEDGVWFGEYVGTDEEGKLEVFYICRPRGKWIWEYEKEWQTISKWTILEHIPLDKTNPVESYKKLGFHPLTEETFLKLDEIDCIPRDVLIPTGYFDQEEEEEDSDDSLKDFIVPDEEGEAFTHAPLDSEFVQETHEIVNQDRKSVV